MKKIIKHIFAGIGQVLVLSPDREYTKPGADGFLSDSRRLTNDSHKVVEGLKAKAKLASNDKSVNCPMCATDEEESTPLADQGSGITQ